MFGVFFLSFFFALLYFLYFCRTFFSKYVEQVRIYNLVLNIMYFSCSLNCLMDLFGRMCDVTVGCYISDVCYRLNTLKYIYIYICMCVCIFQIVRKSSLYGLPFNQFRERKKGKTVQKKLLVYVFVVYKSGESDFIYIYIYQSSMSISPKRSLVWNQWV